MDIIGISPGVQNIMSVAKNSVVTCNYGENYALEGKAFQIQRRFTVPQGAGTGIYDLVLDTRPLVAAGLRIFILPLILGSTGGLVYINTFKCSEFTGGTEIIPARLNSTVENYALSKFWHGSTNTEQTTNEYREYTIGVKSTNQSAGGGTSIPDMPKQFPAGAMIGCRFINQETFAIVVNFGMIFYEIV